MLHNSLLRKSITVTTYSLLAASLAISGACEEKKKSSSKKSSTPTVEDPDLGSPDTTETPETPTDGTGTTPSFVTPETFKPLTNVAPQSGNNMAQMMAEVSELIHGFDATLEPFSVEGYTPSNVETEVTTCANQDNAQTKFQKSGNDWSLVQNNPNFHQKCVTDIAPRVQGFYRAPAKSNLSLNCEGMTEDLTGIPWISNRISKGYCETGTAATYKANLEIEAKQYANEAAFNADQPLSRYFKRTFAVTNRSGENCAWSWNAAEKVKVFNDCVFLDRIDGDKETSTRYVYAEFDKVVGQTSNSGGWKLTAGVVNVVYNNWKGQITLSADGKHKYVMKKEGSSTQLNGEIAVPAGHGGDPGSQPTGGNGGTGAGYTPVGGAGTTETRCASSITYDNITQNGNGVVTLFNVDSGTSRFLTGYVHESANSPKQAFVARLNGTQLAWCRTYLTAATGEGQGASVNFSGDKLYLAFVSKQNNYPTVGQTYLTSHPQVGRDVAYIAQVDPQNGNVVASTWFDFTQNSSGTFSTVLLDNQGTSGTDVRIRAFVKGGKPTGCPNVASADGGNYTVVVRGDLSGLTAAVPAACP